MTRLFPLLALAVTLAACDASAPTRLSDADLDDAAVAVASAVAVDAGGLLEDAASSASLAAPSDGARHPARRGCAADRSYDAVSGTWTAVFDCERGDPDGRFYASFDRTALYRFLDANGDPQEQRAGAETVEYGVASGSSLFRSPRGVHALTSLSSDFVVTDVQSELVTVNGTVQRAATDTLRGRRGERTLAYQLDATLVDVQGPRSTQRRWRQAVDGTITGTLSGTITRTPAGGETSTRSFDEAFEINFPVTASGDRVAQIVLGGRTYRADVETGEVAGVTD